MRGSLRARDMLFIHAMQNVIKRDAAGLADDPNEDAIELTLGPEQMRLLFTATAEAQLEALPVDFVGAPPHATPSHLEAEARGGAAHLNSRLRWPRLSFDTASLLAITAIALASTAYRYARDPVRAPAQSSAITSNSATTASESRGELVRIQNPFDPSEVFDFPPRTSDTAAHDFVANLLLERGRNRLDRLIGTRRINSRRVDRSPARNAAPDAKLALGPLDAQRVGITNPIRDVHR
jgi:hypothetical protein